MTRRTWVVGVMAAALGSYSYALTRIVHGLHKLKPGANDWRHTMSVIIPARNEARTIRRCLKGILAQDYPRYLYEIVVVNDRSTDRTAEIVEELRARNPHIRLVNVTSVPPGTAPKKHAVALGVEHALGQIIVTTDADCTHSPGWLSGINREFAPDVGVVVGHTLYRKPSDRFEGVQSIDYLSHRIIGAGMIGEGEALISTASNLAYRKSVFEQVGGFGEVAGVVSGDDDLFLQRVHTNTSWRIAAATTPETFVRTEPVRTWKQFLSQRARWGSKATHYHSGVLPFLVATFALLVLIVVTFPFAVVRPKKWLGLWALLAAKTGVDYWVVRSGAEKFGQSDLMKHFWLAEFLNPFYVVAALIWGIFGKFTWKGSSYRRDVKSER